MTVLPIRHLPEDAVLRRKARKVSRVDASLQRIIEDMIDTMQQAKGLGLAAPQVGVPLKVIVVQMPEQEAIALINPEIVERSGEQEVVEGCLSVPGYYGRLKRSATITVRGRDRQGKALKIRATGLMAEVFEHEIDHLNGILYVDYVDTPDKLHRVEQQPG